MTNPTSFVSGRLPRGETGPATRASDRKAMKAQIRDLYNPRKAKCHCTEIKSQDYLGYYNSFEWRGFELWATSPFMYRMMKRIAELTDAGVEFTAIIDRFNGSGKRGTVCFYSRNPYSHHILVAESSVDAQWISVVLSFEEDKRWMKPHIKMEVNPDMFVHIVGDERTGYDWECFPKEMASFINREDMREWLDAMADRIGYQLNAKHEDH